MTTASMYAEIRDTILMQDLYREEALQDALQGLDVANQALVDLLNDSLDSTYVLEDNNMSMHNASAAAELELELMGAELNQEEVANFDAADILTEELANDLGRMLPIGINFPQGPTDKARFIAATPENLLQAGRALADLADGRSSIEKILMLKSRQGAVVKSPSESGFSLNTILNAGKSGNFSCFRVMKMGQRGEHVHPRFSSLMNKNHQDGYDPRLTVTKHVIMALILLDLEPVFVDVDGTKLDHDNCWQLIETGMAWQYAWLNPAQ